ncbi:MAG: hypothetical protein OXT06_06855 [Rhodospirillaceae bacterium]|nr:hypothetical protein [Rhodospirillaceae bacterium]
MEAAPRLIDISEKRAARRDAAPLTGDLLARKGEAVSAARDVLNAQEAGLLPPAEPHAQADSAKHNYAKIWIAIVAVLLVGGAVGAGYALRPALEPTQAVAPSEPVPPVEVKPETRSLTTAAGPAAAKEDAKAAVVESTPPETPKAAAPVSAKTQSVTPATVAADSPAPVQTPVPPVPVVAKAEAVPPTPLQTVPKAPAVSTETVTAPSVPPPPKAVPVVPQKTVRAAAVPEKAIANPIRSPYRQPRHRRQSRRRPNLHPPRDRSWLRRHRRPRCLRRNRPI